MSTPELGLILERITPEEIAFYLKKVEEFDLPYALEIREEIREIEQLRTLKPKTSDE